MKKILLVLSAAAMVSACAGNSPKNTVKTVSPPQKAVYVKPPLLKMMLPEVIYAYPGVESNIYFENVVDSANPFMYAFEVQCKVGTHGNKRWFWTPAAKDAGKTFDFELRLFNDCGMVTSAKSKVVVARTSADYKKKITLALLGASGVNCQFPSHLLQMMRDAGFANYTPVGNHAGGGRPVVKGGIAHDGYGGFSWGSFLTRWAYSAEELPQAQNKAEEAQMRSLGVSRLPKSQAYRLRSPLLRIVNGKKVVDIPAWFKKVNNGNAPDFILIQLGGNDMFGASAEKLERRRNDAINNARTLLKLLRKHAPNAVIGVATTLAGCSQDGFGANYGSFQSKYQFRRNIFSYNRALADLIKSLKDPRIKLIPLHQSIDPENSYITKKSYAHARSKKRLSHDCNALHPTRDGGKQLGDVFYCWLRKELEK